MVIITGIKQIRAIANSFKANTTIVIVIKLYKAIIATVNSKRFCLSLKSQVQVGVIYPVNSIAIAIKRVTTAP